jgi:hypothetical protein
MHKVGRPADLMSRALKRKTISFVSSERPRRAVPRQGQTRRRIGAVLPNGGSIEQSRQSGVTGAKRGTQE